MALKNKQVLLPLQIIDISTHYTNKLNFSEFS